MGHLGFSPWGRLVLATPASCFNMSCPNIWSHVTMDWLLRTWEPKWTFTSLGYFCQICGHGDEKIVNTEVLAHRGMFLKWIGSHALCPDPAMASMLLLWFEVKSLVIVVYSVVHALCVRGHGFGSQHEETGRKSGHHLYTRRSDVPHCCPHWSWVDANITLRVS